MAQTAAFLSGFWDSCIDDTMQITDFRQVDVIHSTSGISVKKISNWGDPDFYAMAINGWTDDDSGIWYRETWSGTAAMS